MSQFRVAEIFGPTVQGEGTMVGMPTFFVRLGGCDYRCSWCDSLHAVLPEHRPSWARMTAAGIADRLLALGAQPKTWITLSGGNPALQPIDALLPVFHMKRWRVAMETQASVAKPWFSALDHLCLSPKPPSSGNPTPLEDVVAALAVAPPDHVVKVVVFTDEDFSYARRVFDRVPDAPHCISVGNAHTLPDEPTALTRARLLDEYAVLAARVARECPTVRVLPQLHAVTWGNARGV